MCYRHADFRDLPRHFLIALDEARLLQSRCHLFIFAATLHRPCYAVAITYELRARRRASCHLSLLHGGQVGATDGRWHMRRRHFSLQAQHISLGHTAFITARRLFLRPLTTAFFLLRTIVERTYTSELEKAALFSRIKTVSHRYSAFAWPRCLLARAYISIFPHALSSFRKVKRA